MKPGKYEYSEPFRSQLIALIEGREIKKPNEFVQKAMRRKPPSEKQIVWLEKFGVEIPNTMAEASELLDKCFGKS